MNILIWPIPHTEVAPRNIARLELVTKRKLLVCDCVMPTEVGRFCEVQTLFNIDRCGPTGIEHRVVMAEETLPVLLINYRNEPIMVQAMLKCFDVTDMVWRDVVKQYAAWLRLQRKGGD